MTPLGVNITLLFFGLNGPKSLIIQPKGERERGWGEGEREGEGERGEGEREEGERERGERGERGRGEGERLPEPVNLLESNPMSGYMCINA